jgi:ABC-type dipeptide/oligopeptide/nickel transport system permease component
MGSVVLIAVLYVFVNLATDALSLAIDPRFRTDE